MEKFRGIGTKFSGKHPPGGRVLLHFSRVRDASGTWHMPSREGLQKFVRALIGQTRDTADSKLAGHTCATPTCVLLWLPFFLDTGGKLFGKLAENCLECCGALCNACAMYLRACCKTSNFWKVHKAQGCKMVDLT